MKALNRAIDKFCYKHPRFGIPRLMLYIVVGTAIVYLFSIMDTTGMFQYYLTFSPAAILRGQVWRLVTWIFIPESDKILFVVISLYFYYFIGSTLEQEWGSARFTIYYIFGVILNMVFASVVYLITHASVFISSYYLNMSMFFAFAAMFPDHTVLLIFIIRIKMKWLALIDAALFLYYIIILPFPVMLLPVVAVLNFLIFCGSDLLSFLRPLKNRASRNTINFRKAAKKVNRENAKAPYRHKCAVCGRTDAEFPNLEFRYCSRCEGYHCFCMDHINNHIHFKE